MKEQSINVRRGSTKYRVRATNCTLLIKCNIKLKIPLAFNRIQCYCIRVHLGGPNPLLLKWIQSALSVSLMKFNRGEAVRGANDVAKRLIAASGTGPTTFRYVGTTRAASSVRSHTPPIT